MKVFVNDKPHETFGKTVAELVDELGLPHEGVAVAKGTDIVPRTEWEATAIANGDRFMIIKAASGG